MDAEVLDKDSAAASQGRVEGVIIKDGSIKRDDR